MKRKTGKKMMQVKTLKMQLPRPMTRSRESVWTSKAEPFFLPCTISFAICFFLLLIFLNSSAHAATVRRSVTSGLSYYNLELNRPDGPVAVHILTVDLTRRERSIRVVSAGDSINDRKILTDLSRRHKPLAAINGSYFGDKSGPLGILIIDGELVSVPILRRAALGLTSGKKLIWGHPVFQGHVSLAGGSAFVLLSGINQFPSGKESCIMMFTPEFGFETPQSENCSEFTVLRNRVVSLGSGKSIIPPGGFVLSAYNHTPDELGSLSLLDQVQVMTGIEHRWSEAEFAVGGGPRLIKDGEVCVTFREENFRSDVYAGKAPRTAVGTTDGTRLVIVVVDGRQPGYSEGMELEELARLMLSLGCREALNLDGGGSSTLVIRNQLMNRPSDGKERPVSNALMVF
ncbi:MAG: phosphodiester glycosidase family protein [Candidatus Wallbacteria bacterium]|nr:phosphodiester glycosidase family protein [Candidatus Wallbacteria bacterium]